MSTTKQASRLYEKRVNRWLLYDIFRSEIMTDDESNELMTRIGNTHLFKETCIKYIEEKGMCMLYPAAVFFDKRKDLIEGKLIPFSELEWVDCGRSLSFVANFIHADYKIHTHGNTPTLMDIVAPSWSLSPDGSGIDYDGLMMLIDHQCRVGSINHIRVNLEGMKIAWLRIHNDFKKPFWFPSDRYENKYHPDYQWVLSYFEKNNMMNGNVDLWFKKSPELKVHSIFDQWAKDKSTPEVELFIIRLKKAWHQKKFRDSVTNKKVLNTYISKECKKQLDYLSHKKDIKINEMIEILVHEAYAKAKLKVWEQ